jgi:hypothetical protein
MTAFNIVRCRVKPSHEEHSSRLIGVGGLKCVDFEAAL